MKSIYMLSWIDEIKELGFLGLVESIFRGVIYSFVSMIYSMIRYIYNIFLMLCNGQILDSKSINTLFGRVGLLLGVIMLFRVAISFVQAIIDPDNGMDGKKGVPGVIKKVIIVIIMFGISTYTFDLLREVQALIIKNNVVSNFILPSQVNTSNFGGALSANLFTAFYNVDPAAAEAMESGDTSKMDDNAQECADKKYIEGLQQHIAEYNDFSYMKDQCLKATVTYADRDSGKETGGFVIEFNFFFSILLGVFVIYYLLSFCMQVGMRIVQLSVLQIISPMAFISYLSPKEDNMFSKWLKVYFSTYIDVFVRMGIISFVCYICAVLMEGWNKPCSSDTNRFCFWNTVGNPSGFTKVVMGAIMIIALFRFAKKAPELLKNIGLGNSASGLGFSPGGFSNFSSALLGGTVGGFMGAATHYKSQRNTGKNPARSLISGAGGFITGAGRTFYAGSKGGMKSIPQNLAKQRQANNKYNDLVVNDGNLFTAAREFLGDAFGESKGQKEARLVTGYNSAAETMDKLKELAHQTDSYKEQDRILQRLIHSGASPEAQQAQEQKLKDIEKAIITAGMAGKGLESGEGQDRKITLNDANLAVRMKTVNTNYNSFTESRHIKGIEKEVHSYEELGGQVDYAEGAKARIEGSKGFHARRTSGEFVGNNIDKTGQGKK